MNLFSCMQPVHSQFFFSFSVYPRIHCRIRPCRTVALMQTNSQLLNHQLLRQRFQSISVCSITGVICVIQKSFAPNTWTTRSPRGTPVPLIEQATLSDWSINVVCSQAYRNLWFRPSCKKYDFVVSMGTGSDTRTAPDVGLNLRYLVFLLAAYMPLLPLNSLGAAFLVNRVKVNECSWNMTLASNWNTNRMANLKR